MLFDYITGLLFFVKDANRHLIYINQELADFMGLESKESIVGHPDSEFFQEDIGKSYAADDKRVIEEGISINNKVELITTSQRLIQWYITNKIPLFDREGKICGLAGVTHKFEENTNALHRSALDLAIGYISKNYSQEIKLKDLAKACSLSHIAFNATSRRAFTSLLYNT